METKVPVRTGRYLDFRDKCFIHELTDGTSEYVGEWPYRGKVNTPFDVMISRFKHARLGVSKKQRFQWL